MRLPGCSTRSSGEGMGPRALWRCAAHNSKLYRMPDECLQLTEFGNKLRKDFVSAALRVFSK